LLDNENVSTNLDLGLVNLKCNYIEKDKLRSKYIGFYNHLKDLPKESILLDEGEFYGADMIKFAYLNGIEIEK